jgi:hypothetical protein
MNQVVGGAIAMGFLVAGVFFFRFWRETRDRLFALFAVSFFVLAVNRAGIGLAGSGDARDYLYWVRLLAFALILAAILDKNRSRQPPPAL